MSGINAVERAILALSPAWAARRARSRLQVAAYGGAYEATQHSRLRKTARDYGDGNAVARTSQAALRDMARNLDRNHDLSRGILNVLVRNIVGANGIGVLPQPRDTSGNVIDGLAHQLQDLWEAWSRQPEVTGEFNRARAEQLACRSWMRDGESLCQYVEGNVPKLNHATQVPFSLEYLESDMVPIDYEDASQNILQGVQCDAWGKPQTYYVYKTHPGARTGAWPQLKAVPSSAIGHIKLVDRFGMRRGVSMFASVLTRLDDLKDYEESERIAAKVAASMAAVIKKGAPDDYQPNPSAAQREMRMAPGMIFDTLAPGESVEIIDSKRPNPQAVEWRYAQLRAVAAGADVSHSSASKNYDGTYSAQRQELVEQWEAYKLLSQAFIDQHTSEVYVRFVSMCILAGLVRIPRGATFSGVAHALYIPPAMPWIDPVKEASGWQLREQMGWISGSEVVLLSGRNPADVIRAETKWRADRAAAGLPDMPMPAGSQPTVTQAAPAANGSQAHA